MARSLFDGNKKRSDSGIFQTCVVTSPTPHKDLPSEPDSLGKCAPFPELSDEDTLTLTSVFDKAYFEICPPEMKVAGKLRAVIAELLHDDDEDLKTDAFTCMFLFLHFSSPSAEAAHGEEKEMRSKIAGRAAKVMTQHFEHRDRYRVAPLDPQWMVIAFLHELMKRIIAAVHNQVPINSTDCSLVTSLANTAFNRACEGRTTGMSSFAFSFLVFIEISFLASRVSPSNRFDL